MGIKTSVSLWRGGSFRKLRNTASCPDTLEEVSENANDCLYALTRMLTHLCACDTCDSLSITDITLQTDVC